MKPPARKDRRRFGRFKWWQIAVFIMGCLATVALIFGLFLSSDRLSGDIYSRNTYAPETPEFTAVMSHLADTSVEHGGEAELLLNGDAFLERLLGDIRGAEDHVTFTNFIWHKGEFSDRIFAALLERARSGVRVLILLDDVGGNKAPDDKIEELRSLGGEVEYFRTPRLTRITRFHKRNHRRAIVIDGKVGYVGGIAIEDAWLGDADAPDRWHDTMVRFVGPTVPHIQNGFAELWTATTGEILGDTFYAATEEKTGELATVSLLSSPAPDTQMLPLAFWYAFASAERSIYITNPYFLPSPPLRKEIENAARRGVDVRLILPSKLTDARSVRLASQSNYEPLLAAGVRIYEYQRSRVHAKQVVVDGVWSMVGSANLDSRSFLLNEENVIGVQDRAFGKSVEDMFLSDLEDSREITKEEWEKRSFTLKILQATARLFQKQL